MKNIFRHIIAIALTISCTATAFPQLIAKAAENNITPPGWVLDKSSNTVGGVTVDTTEKYSGKASMKLNNQTPRTEEQYVRISYEKIPVTPGHT